MSLLLHLNLLVPLLIVVFYRASREEAERAEEVDVGFENVAPEELPRELPPLDDTPEPHPAVPEKTAKAEARPEEIQPPKPEPEPEKKVAEVPPPAPAAPPPPPAPTPPAAPKPPPPQAHEKIVDLENEKDVPPPPDAKYLAQKNSRTDQETRATQTNLDRAQKGEDGPAQAEGKRADNIAGDDKAKVADLEDQKSKLGHEAPESPVRFRPEALTPPERSQPLKSPVLSLRDAAPRSHEITPETVDPSLPHDPAGLLAQSRRKSFKDSEGGKLNQGKRVMLALSGKDYEYMFGAEAKADRQLAQQERSTRLGARVSKRLAQVRSSLENFIPDVKPGTTTVLNARAAPFAAFIARVHRQIHKYWGYGVLEDWDSLPSSSPFNNDSLNTTLEIVLNDDGTVSKITPVKVSGYVAYDAAAVDAVLAAAPFPQPPSEILSVNGKVYFHWNFAR
ncbi:MAG TPA: TonB family protein, partial [Polyangia bacterium]|nr:TonB family protein [Polyangia bacterium]